MTDEMIDAVARAIAKSDGLEWDEVCGLEADRDGCDSGTCIAALCEDHDPDWSRSYYIRVARAAIRAAAPLILDMAAKETNTWVWDIKPNILKLKDRFK